MSNQNRSFYNDDCTEIQKERFYQRIYEMDRDANTDMSKQRSNNFNLIEIWKDQFRGRDLEPFLTCVRKWDMEDDGIFLLDQTTNTISLTDFGRNRLEEQLNKNN